MKKKSKKIVLSSIIASFVIVTVAAIVPSLFNNFELENKQNEFLEELENNKGTYDEKSIVLQNTSKTRAKELSERFNAKLRSINNGKFATLTLPNDITILDVVKDDGNKVILDEFTIDYKAKIADFEIEDNSSEFTPESPNYEVYDELYERQSYLDYINIGDAWKNNSMGNNRTIAVIDTGIDTDHVEFQGRISEYSYNATEDKIVKDYILEDGSYDWSIVEDEQGHGTAVTGVIGASMDSVGITGILPKVNILTIKAECDSDGVFKRISDLVYGYYYAIERDVDIVNMSFAYLQNVSIKSPFNSPSQLAVDSDIITVAAAGNYSSGSTYMPAAEPNIIGVGALKENSFEIADYSNYGESVDVVAPGTVYTTKNDGTYQKVSGTSFSAPLVAASLGLYYSIKLNSDVIELLYASTKDLGTLGKDIIYGYGALDVNALVCEKKGTVKFDMRTNVIDNITKSFVINHTLQDIPEPERPFSVFDGWYYDKEYTRELNIYEDIFTKDLTLYAKWCNGEDGVPFEYSELNDGTIEITGYKKNKKYITIPSKINNKNVSSIGESAFANSKIVKINLPDTIKNISDKAFYSSRVEYINIPKSLKYLGDFVFANCINLKYINIPQDSELETFGIKSFNGCSNLDYIYIPKNVDEIGDNPFLGCVSLKEINVHENNKYYKSLNGVLFNKSMTNLLIYPAGKNGDYQIPSMVKIIDEYAFAYSKITSIDLSNVTTINNSAFAGSNIKSIVIKDSVSKMGEGIFENCDYLINVTLNKTIKSIPVNTFKDCDLLKYIEIPKQITMIESGAFMNSGIENIVFNQDSSLSCISDSAFYFSNIKNIVIPKSCEIIGPSAFRQCQYLESISFEDGSNLLTIGNHAFAETYLLKSISIPNSVNFIDIYAFSNSSIESINLPNNIGFISSYLFSNCRNLKNIEIPDSVTEIGIGAFSGCSSLESINLPSSLTTIDRFVFSGCTNLNQIIIPNSVEYILEEAFSYSGLVDITIPNNIKEISEMAFLCCDKLINIFVDENNKVYSDLEGVLHSKNLDTLITYPAGRTKYTYTINEHVIYIGNYAFYSLSSLSSIYFPSNLLKIGDYSFFGCDMYTYKLPVKLESIGDYAFAENNRLNNLSIPDSVISLGKYFVYGDTRLSKIEFNDTSKLTRISYGLFANSGIVTIRIPSNVSTMAQYAFSECNSLISITFAANSKLDILPSYIINDCSSLTSIVFEGDNNLVSISANAFRDVNSLERIDFGNAKLENIDNYSFMNCSKLKEIILPNTVKSIGRYAFNGCSSLSTLSLPYSLEYIGEYAFYNTNDVVLYFKNEILPLYLCENWDNGVGIYYLGASKVESTDEFDYSITETGNIIINKYKGNENTVDFTNVNLGGNIVSISGYAFYDTSIKEVILPNTLVSIQKYAFAFSDIEAINIPSSVSFIGQYAFFDTYLKEIIFENNSNIFNIEKYAFAKCLNLKEIVLPKSLQELGSSVFEKSGLVKVEFESGFSLSYIPQNAFLGTKVENINLPDSIILIKNNAFRDNMNLQSIQFGKNEIMIMDNAFYNTGLVNVYIGENITYIGEYAFVGLKNLTSFEVDKNNLYYSDIDGALYNKSGTKIISYPAGKPGDIVLPDSLEEIGYGAFENTIGTKILFNKNGNLNSIGFRAFYGAQNLTEIVIPKTIVEIDYYAFANCQKLVSFKFEEGTQISIIAEGAFYGCRKLINVELPDSLNVISEYTFYGCSSLVSLPALSNDGLINIKEYAFAYTGIESLTLSISIEEIGNYAFMGSKLKEIIIPKECENTVKLGLGVFEKCNDLNRITLPFIGSISNDSQWFVDEEITWFGYIFGANSYENNSYYIPKSLKTVIFNNNKMTIGYGAFYNITTLDTIILPSDILGIYNYAFYNCGASYELLNFGDFYTKDHKIETELSNTYLGNNICGELILPSSLEKINYNAFYNCNKLQKIIIPGEIKIIENYAFSNCEILNEVYLKDGVEEIGDNVFENCVNLRNVTLSKSLTTIEFATFRNCSSLESIVIPEGVKEIYVDAFHGCSSLESINLPNTLEYIGNNAFENCSSLESIVIPEGVTNIGPSAFSRCSSLTSITIPVGVTNIGSFAFSGCSSLESINLPNTLEYIGNNAFSLNTTNFYIDNILTYLKLGKYININTNKINLYLNNKLIKDLVIPEGVQEISSSIFKDFESIETITLPNTLETIGSSAFSGCSSLESILIPESVTSIGGWAFFGCSSLRDVYINDISSWCNIDFEDSNSNPMYHANNVYLNEKIVTSVVVPEDVTRIKNYSFYNFNNMVSIELSNTITSIGYSAFSECSSLKNINLPDNIKTIENYTFENCSSLESIVIPESVTFIGYSAFDECSSLKNINLPDNIKTIENYTFYNCSSLESVVIPESVTSIGSSAFNGCSSLKNINLPDNIKTIENYTFYNCSSLESIVIPESVTSIGYRAFYNCYKIRSIVLSSNLLSIDNEAFRYCTSLIEIYNNSNIIITIGETDNGYVGYYAKILYNKDGTKNYFNDLEIFIIETIDGFCFLEENGEYQLIAYLGTNDIITLPENYNGNDYTIAMKNSTATKIIIPDSLKKLNDHAFEDCYDIEEIEFNKSLTLGYNTFTNCINLKKVYVDSIETWCSMSFLGNDSNPLFYAKELYINGELVEKVEIPNNINWLRDYVFINCKSIKEIYIPDTITSIGYSAFSGCCSLKNINLPDNIKTIENYTFENCSSLESIVIPESVTFIGYSAFDECSSLESINLPNNIGFISSYLFSNCRNLKNIEIPDSVTEIGIGAFSRCSSLESIVIPESVTSIGEWAFNDCDSLKEITCSLKLYNESILKNLKANVSFNFYDNIEGYLILDKCIYSSDMKQLIYVDSNIKGKFVVPEGVQEISAGAFGNCESIIEVILPSSLLKIENYAFEKCISLKVIEIPNSTTKIGDYAFSGCNNLENILLSTNLIYLGVSAFQNCESITEIIIPSSLETIESFTFRNCINLKNIILLEGLKIIDYGAFYNCDNILEITIPNGVEKINQMFIDCDNVEKVTLPNTVKSCVFSGYSYFELAEIYLENIETWLNSVDFCYASKIYVNNQLVECLIIPETITQIRESAFKNCSSIREVYISDSVTYIGDEAFSGCNNISKLVLPKYIDYFGWNAFFISEIQEITLPETMIIGIEGLYYSEFKTIHIRSLEFYLNLNLQFYSQCLYLNNELIVDLKIPEGITTIREKAFMYNRNIKSVTLPNTITSIGSSAFSGCSSLESIVIPEGVTSIGSSAFSGCSSLESIVIPEGVTSIGDWAFYGCSSLESIVIPEGVTSIGDFTFYGCSGLESIVIPEGVTYIGSSAFTRCSSLESIELPSTIKSIETTFESKKVYFKGNIETWCNINFNEDTIGNKCSLYIDGEYINNQGNLVIPEGVKNINSYVFSGYGFNYSSVTLPSTLVSIQDFAFSTSKNWIIYNNSSLDLTIGSNDYGSIAYNAKIIYNSDGSKEYIANNETILYETTDGYKFIYDSINGYVLYDYIGNKNSITLPEYINGETYTINLRKSLNVSIITIPGTVIIHSNAFSEMIYLKEVVIQEGVTNIASSAFYGCSSLESIVIPEGVTRIRDFTFYGCSSLTSITIPEGVTYIGSSAFRNCTSLDNIDLPETLSDVAEDAFYNTGIYNQDSNWIDGFLYIDNYLADIKDVEIWTNLMLPPNITLTNTRILNKLNLLLYLECSGRFYSNHMNELPIDNIITIVFNDDLTSTIKYSETLKNIVLKKGTDLHNNDHFSNLNNIKIFIEEEENNLMWKDRYGKSLKNWNNYNEVYYGGEWITVSFYDENKNLIDKSFYSNTDVIRQPYYEVEDNNLDKSYFLGWDTNNDGIVDFIPATSVVDIEAYAVLSDTAKKYTINYIDEIDKSIIYSYELSYGDNIELPNNPYKKGYEFIGWKNYYEGMKVTGNIDIYAMFEHKGGDHIFTILSIYNSCENEGYDIHTCEICGYEYKDSYVEKLEHNYGDYTIDLEPTCEKTGHKYRKCIDCGSIDECIIEELGHKYICEEIKKSTCETYGKNKYYCECGSTYEEELSIQHHIYEKNYVSKSLLEQLRKLILDIVFGYEGDYAFYYQCKECNQIYIGGQSGYTIMSVQNVNCLHNECEWQSSILPSCEDGYEILKCLDCEEIVGVRAVLAIGHIYEEKIIAPTCEAEGYTTHTCKHCGKTYIDSYVVAIGHDLTYYDYKEPTCEENGHNAYEECNRCDYTTYQEVEAAGHDYNWIEEISESCEEDGILGHYHCEACDTNFDKDYKEINNLVIPAHGHSYNSVVTEPTCEAEGYTTHICKHCGKSYIDSYVVAIGHDLTYYDYKEPTCEENGHNAYEECNRCDYTTYQEVEAAGHDYNWIEEISESCEEDGILGHYHCEACDTNFDKDYKEINNLVIPAHGHSYNSVVTEPTCEAEGYTTHICKHCGNSYIDSYIEPHGHNMQPATYEEPSKCSICGYTEGEPLKPSDVNTSSPNISSSVTSSSSSSSTINNISSSITSSTEQNSCTSSSSSHISSNVISSIVNSSIGNSKGDSNVGLVIGIIIGGTVSLAGALFLILKFIKKRRA